MSTCLLTTLPVVVNGDREKMGYFLLKRHIAEINGSTDPYRVTIWLQRIGGTAPLTIRWNGSTKYSSGTYESPYIISGEGAYNTLTFTRKNDSVVEYDAPALWLEKSAIGSIELRANCYIHKDTGFEYFFKMPSFEFLSVDDFRSIQEIPIKSSTLKGLQLDVSELQNYEIQEILNNCPGLVYVRFHVKMDLTNTNTTAEESASQPAASKIRNITYPDNLKYIRNSPTRIEQLSANCIECDLTQGSTIGNVDDFIAKAVAAGRVSTGEYNELSIKHKYTSGNSTLSSELIYDQNGGNPISLKQALINENITSEYFKIKWIKEDGEIVKSLEADDAQNSNSVYFYNYRTKLSDDFTE